MSYQVLARKWRPKTFSELVGQEHVVAALSNALDNNRLHHAYLFTGTRGVGKTTIARIFSKSLNCETGMSATPCGVCGTCKEIEQGYFVDLLEIDAASRTKVEDTRELLDNVQYKPTRGDYKVYLIDEVHMLSKHSFNALLKTLEEPPPHVKFLLATTDPQKLPITILSRCLQFNLKALSREQIGQQLENILRQENVPAEAAAIAQLARAAQGSMRDALSLTDQAIAQGNGQLTGQVVRDMLGLMDKTQIIKLVNALLNKDSTAMMEQVESLSYQAPDYAQVLAEILSLLHQVALTQFVPDACKLDTMYAKAIYQMAKSVPAEQVQLLYQIALQGRKDLPHAADGRTGLEMTLLRMLAFSPDGLSLSSAELASAAADTPVTQSVFAASQPTGPVAQTQPASAPAVDSPIPESDLTMAQEHMDDEQAMDAMNAEQDALLQQAHELHPGAGAEFDSQGDFHQPPPDFEPVSPAETEFTGEPQQNLAPESSVEPQPETSSLSKTANLLALKQKLAGATGGEPEVKKPTPTEESGTTEADPQSKVAPVAIALPETAPEPRAQNSESDVAVAQLPISEPVTQSETAPTPETAPVAASEPPVNMLQPQPLDEPPPWALHNPVADMQPAQDSRQNLAPPWNINGESASAEVPSALLNRGDNPQKLEEQEEFDPTAHLEDDDNVEVDFEVPAFLPAGDKVLVASQLDTWSQLIEQMQVAALTKQLALHAAYSKQDELITLTLPESKEHLNTESARTQLEAALGQALQQEIRLTVELKQPVNTPFAVQKRINQVRQQHAEHVVQSDAVITSLRDTFAANVVEHTIKPR